MMQSVPDKIKRARIILVNIQASICRKVKLQPEVFFLSVSVLDRVMLSAIRGDTILNSITELTLVAIVAVSIAAKYYNIASIPFKTAISCHPITM